ncbi:GvpL/GvpF family gas vesicle protein [Egicoccus sp. AB-alg2]|uniref:GvpL/GvpF family gas vesicle protein n=1 Tax=Egicoccus sp. AB-alg2 TaxID=3242693 RepID=UPI00359DD568
MPLLVHGVVPRTPRLDDAAFGDVDAPTLVAGGDLAAIVTEVAEDDLVPSRRMLLRHTQVVEAAAKQTTVVPMRFGVAVPSADRLVEDFLAPAAERLTATIQRLQGHQEYRLRGRYDEPAALRAVLAADPRAARLHGRRGMDAKLELGERVVQGLERRRATDTARALEALRPVVSDVVETAVTDPLDVFALSLLVASDAEDGFDRAVESVAESLAPEVKLELVGPMPAYSFVEEEG